MAVSVVSKTGLFNPYIRDQASVDHVVRLALYGNGDQPKDATAATLQLAQRTTARQMLARAMGKQAADFRVFATTSDNSALAQALDLTDEGVTFPAATVRKIRMVMRSSNDADTFVQTIEQN